MSLLADMKVWKVEYNPRCKFQLSPEHSHRTGMVCLQYFLKGVGVCHPHCPDIKMNTMEKDALQLSVLGFWCCLLTPGSFICLLDVRIM